MCTGFKSVLKQVNVVCRAFMWTTTCYSPNPGCVGWEEVCKPRGNGGLGFRDIMTWNVAMIGKIA